MPEFLRKLLGTRSHLVGLAGAGAATAAGVAGWSGDLWIATVPIAYALSLSASLTLTGESLREGVSKGSSISPKEEMAALRMSLAELRGVAEEGRSRFGSEMRRVESLIESIETVSERLGREEGHGEARKALRRIGEDYLPSLTETFLSIDPEFARTREIRKGRTAAAIFIGRVELLEQQVSRVKDELSTSDAGELLAHARFLDEKFADPDEVLGLSKFSETSEPKLK